MPNDDDEDDDDEEDDDDDDTAGFTLGTVVSMLNWKRTWTVPGILYVDSSALRNLRCPDNQTTQSMLTLTVSAAAVTSLLDH